MRLPRPAASAEAAASLLPDLRYCTPPGKPTKITRTATHLLPLTVGGVEMGSLYGMCTLHCVIYGTINKRTVMALSRCWNETLDGDDFVCRCSGSTEPNSCLETLLLTLFQAPAPTFNLNCANLPAPLFHS